MRSAFTTALFMICMLGQSVLAQATDYAAWVDPRIGTSNDGNTHIGAVMPWGLASLAPRNTLKREGVYTSVNYYGGGTMHYGLAPINLSGVGCPDWGSPYMMPGSGSIRWHASEYGQRVVRETTSPGYYQVELADGSQTEATATQRSGMIRYRFPKRDSNWILLDLGPALCPLDGAALLQVQPTQSGLTIQAWRQQGKFCGNANRSRIYLHLQIEAATAEVIRFQQGKAGSYTPDTAISNDIRLLVRLKPGVQEALVRLGVSFVSAANAELNLRTEQDNHSFEAIRKAARSTWNQALGKVQVQRGPDSLKQIFYTGLYHLLLHPNVLSDVNGQYPLPGGKGIGTAQGYTHYTVFSLWDTYRNVHNLLALLYPAQLTDMVKTLLALGREQGHLPKWELGGQESFVMVGDPAPIVLADSWAMGIRDWDPKVALALAVQGSLRKDLRPGTDAYRQYGYIPQDQKTALGVWGSVSTTLEYNLADDAISRLATAAGDTAAANQFRRQSHSWTQLFDTETRMLRPKLANGQFLTPFNPDTVGGELDWFPSGGPGYVEGNAWHYRFFVPHAIPQLMDKLGGANAFVTALHRTFAERHFVLWNEPDMAYPYLFGYVPTQAWRIAPVVDSLRRRYFRTGIAGLPGNDDCGTLSAWMLFSSLGLYPDHPGSGAYMLGTPAFNEVRLTLDQRFHPGKQIIIRAQRSSSASIHPQQVQWNGQRHAATRIRAELLRSGGTLTFQLADKPGTPYSRVD